MILMYARKWKRPLYIAPLLAGLLVSGCSAGGNRSSTASPSAQTSSMSPSPSSTSSPGKSPSASAAGNPSVKPSATLSPSPIADEAARQASKLVAAMSLEQRVGQLLFVGIDGTTAGAQAKQLIADYHVGGVILFGPNITNAAQAVKLTNALKAANAASGKVPLWLGVDEEGGRVSRMPGDYVNMPTAKAVGDVDNTTYARKIGQLLGKEVQSLGLNVDFAPVLDVNSNPQNPVIGDRSFGPAAALVSRIGIQELKGLQETKVLPVVKHFPGHGDTSVDSHIGLPVVDHDLTRLRNLELVPFKDAIGQQAEAVMVAHLLMRKIDPDYPASQSRAVITGLLRGELGFQGVVITDDLTMGAIAESYGTGTAAVRAIKAGADVALVGHEFAKAKEAYDALLAAAKSGELPGQAIQTSAERIVRLKLTYGLSDREAAAPDVAKLNGEMQDVLNAYAKK